LSDQRSLHIGLILPLHGTQFTDVLAAARAAETARFDELWVPDHWLNQGRPQAGVLECWTVLSAVAAVTQRIGVGTLVLSTPLRQPLWLVKAAATLATLAPDRLTLGLGAGGFTYFDTCAQFGFPVLSPSERVAHVAETLAVLRTALRDDPADFAGRFARARGLRVYPRPPHPIPIVLAAQRPRMLELAAREADGWNCPLPQALESGLAEIKRFGCARKPFRIDVFSVAVLGESDAAAQRALVSAGAAAQRFGDVETHHVFGGPARAAECLANLARRGAGGVTLDVRGMPIQEAVELLARDVFPLLGRGSLGLNAVP